MSKHPFHIVDMSPWPLLSATGSLLFVSGLTSRFHNYDSFLYQAGFLIILLSSWQWWRDVVREATLQGKHTQKVENGIRMGMVLFIVSEVCFFFAFFWAFFHSSLSPGIGISVWPPVGIETIHPFEVPLLNTTVLLASGCTITWAHSSVISSRWSTAQYGFALTTLLGFIFTLLQALEYKYCAFTMADSVYGSAFFLATGFHGLHVILGTIFIVVSWLRSFLSHFTSVRHFGFEASAWYWHFVDVVWLFLFLCIYWWGS